MSVKIMVVEDEPLVAMDLEIQLRTLGYDVVGSADNGEEAILLADSTLPHLVLMDIHLYGEMDGIEAARIIRSRRQIPVIFLTAFSDDATLARAKITEPYGYIVKPFNERDLRTAIEIGLYKFEAERKLRKVERWLAATLQSIGDAVISTDLQGVVNYLNPLAEELTGWTQKQANGQHIGAVLRLIDGATREEVENPVLKALRLAVSVSIEEGTILIARDGKEIPIDDSSAPIRDDDGNLTGVVIVFRDISDRVAAEDARRKAEEHLRHSQKLQTIGQLAGGVAHDFNNLMTVVLCETELMLSRTSDEANRASLQTISQAGERAATLTKQLLAFGRRQVLQPKVLNLNETVMHARAILARLIGEDVELQTVLQPGLPSIKVDPTQIEQVIFNLAVNARDAMPRGGKITLETKTIELDAEYAAKHPPTIPGAYVVLVVSDNGCGMDETTKAHLFEPFFTTKPVGKGTGLGLATVHGIVTQSGGRIEVYSEIDLGTTFRIYFPQTQQLANSSVKREPPPKPAPGSERILIVEDEEIIRTIIQAFLESLGYTVSVAQDAEDARKQFSTLGSDVNLVISDIIMPGETGPELVRSLREIRPDLKVIFMSGYSQEAIERDGILAKGAHFIEKPFHVGEFARVVRLVLDERRAIAP